MTTFIDHPSAAADFGPASLDGMNVRLIFKDRAAALPEHHLRPVQPPR